MDADLSNFGWFSVDEAEKLDLIGKDSPTGTLGQLKKADKIPTTDVPDILKN